MSEKCKSCGAEIEYSAGSQSLKCPYCDAINEIKKEEDALPDEVELIIPLSITADDLEKQAYGYMASGNYTPDDMLEAATFIKRECFYVPAFLFRVDYEATWTASFGYDRQEPYTAYRTVTSNGHSRQEAYTAYRTVTDWRPANGVDAGILSVSTYAGTALRESDLSPADLVPIAIAAGNATNFNASFMKGVEAESFVVPEAAAYTSLADEISGKIDGSVKSHAQGNHQQDWHWNAKMSHSSSTLYVPIGHAVFDYQGTDYHFWIDGIGQAQIRADKLPEDMERKKVVQVGFVPAGIAGVCLMATSYLWGFTWAGLVAAAILGGYAAIRRKSIFGYSQSIRESLLTQIQASASSTRQLSSEEQQKLALAFQRPEKPFFAKTHLDRILLPSLSVAALLGVSIPSYLVSPGYMEGSSRRQAEARESASKVVPTAAPVAVAVAPVERSDTSEQKAAEEMQQKLREAEEKAKKEAEEAANKQLGQAQNISPQPQQAQQPANDLLIRASKCDDIKACIALMIEAADPRSPEAISTAATRIGELNKAQRGDRKVARALNERGLDEFKKKNFAGAIDILKQANAADPADVEILSNLGYVALQANRVDDAVKPLADALLLDPRRTSTWAPIAELYSIKGKNDSAVKALLLGYEFSGNKDKTITVFEEKANTAERESMRPIYAETIKKIYVLRAK